MKLSGIAWMIVFIMFIGKNTIQASMRKSFLMDLHHLKKQDIPIQVVTVTGCNNECDTACCDCDIERQPPLCVLCCNEG
ncbi:hypothetical protein M5689_003418 [Euphorbia peplus]|nr:hypothetical protein M5689_003418 [Euphorbia peplus]